MKSRPQGPLHADLALVFIPPLHHKPCGEGTMSIHMCVSCDIHTCCVHGKHCEKLNPLRSPGNGHRPSKGVCLRTFPTHRGCTGLQ